VELPLFSCYVSRNYAESRGTPTGAAVDGVIGLVGAGGEGTPIPDAQIDTVRSLVETGLPGPHIPS